MTFDDFSKWCEDSTTSGKTLINALLQVLFEVCHVKLGLRPKMVQQEESIIR